VHAFNRRRLLAMPLEQPRRRQARSSSLITALIANPIGPAGPCTRAGSANQRSNVWSQHAESPRK
jgi:hypothetical protein